MERIAPYESDVVFIPVQAVARHFGVLTNTLVRELQQSRVAVISIGAQYQVRQDELDAWLKQKHAEAKAQQEAAK